MPGRVPPALPDGRLTRSAHRAVLDGRTIGVGQSDDAIDRLRAGPVRPHPAHRAGAGHGSRRAGRGEPGGRRRLLELLGGAIDADVTFEPDDPAADDTFAEDPAEATLAWTLGHVIAHVTASAEEAAFLAAELARGILPHGRSRSEVAVALARDVADVRAAPRGERADGPRDAGGLARRARTSMSCTRRRTARCATPRPASSAA